MIIILKLKYKFDMVLANNTLRNIKKLFEYIKTLIEHTLKLFLYTMKIVLKVIDK